MEFGDRLKQVRINADLKQEEVATKLGVNRVTYTNYENNIRFPTKETLLKLITILGLSIDYLISGQEHDDFIKEEDLDDLADEEELDDLVHEDVASYKIPVIDNLSVKKGSISWDNILYYKTSTFPRGEGNNYFYYKIGLGIKDTVRIRDKDLILFHIQKEVTHGSFVIALVDEIIRLGRIEFINNMVLLHPINIETNTLVFNSDSLHKLKILARAIEGVYDLT